jgi:hypothetical protein
VIIANNLKRDNFHSFSVIIGLQMLADSAVLKEIIARLEETKKRKCA